MNSIRSVTPQEIFTLIIDKADIKTIVQCALVDKAWALLIIDNNHLWQHLITRDFQVIPGKYVSLQMPREEYKFLFQHMKKVFAKGGTHVGTFLTPEKNKYYIFPGLHVDTEDRAFIYGSNNIHRTTVVRGEQTMEPLVLPGSFICSKNDKTLVLFDKLSNRYRLLDSKSSLITTITPKERILTFEVLEQGLLTGGENGNIELWSSNGNSLGMIAQTNGMILNLFSTQLPNREPAIVAWHYTVSHPTISLYGLDGKKLEQKNLEILKNKSISEAKKLNKSQFAIILNENDKTSAYIVSTTEDAIPLLIHSRIKNMDVDTNEGKIYLLEDDKPTNGYEKSIKVWNTDGRYFGRVIHQADKIDVFNGKIYLRNAYNFAVEIYDLCFLPKDTKSWYLDLNNFKAFPDDEKDQICGIFYCLIKHDLQHEEDYFGCAQHAFDGTHRFALRFDDSLRKQAIATHLLLKEMKAAIAAQNETAATLCFDQLPKTIQDSLGWGIWIFEGIPIGDIDFGSTFFHANPMHDSVNSAIQCFRENGWSILSYECQQEIREAREVFNAAPTQETIVLYLQNLSPLTHDIIKKCIEVLENTPMKHESLVLRYATSEYKNGVDKTDPIIHAINNLVSKFTINNQGEKNHD